MSLIVRSLGWQRGDIDRRWSVGSRAIEGLVERHVVGEEGTVAKVEKSTIQTTCIIHALRIVCSVIACVVTSGNFSPSAGDVTCPLVAISYTATGIALDIEEILEEGVDTGLVRVGGRTSPGGEITPGVRLWSENPRGVECIGCVSFGTDACDELVSGACSPREHEM